MSEQPEKSQIASEQMQLRVLLPTRILIDQSVAKVIAEDAGGFFCLLPRHVDLVAALVPGLLAFTTTDGREEFLAIDEGTLVKVGPQVLISTMNAVHGPVLGSLRQLVTDRFISLDERERRSRSALAQLEADFVRRFIELRE